MENIYKMILPAAFAFGMAFVFTGCNDDSGKANEWNATYVFLQSNDYLAGAKTFNLTHAASGITGDKVIQAFTVRTQKPVASDIVVNLLASSTGFDQSKVKLYLPQVTIKAGECISEPDTVSVPDLSFMEDTKEEASYSFAVGIAGIQTQTDNTMTSDLRSTIKMTVLKKWMNLAKGIPSGSNLIADRSGWKIVLEDKVENNAGHLTDGDVWTDVARNESGFSFTVDLGKEETLTGLQTSHWMNSYYYAPQKIEVFLSDNGANWKSQGVLDVSGGKQDVSFQTPVKTQYLKYQIITPAPSGRTDITEFNLYEPAPVL